MRAISKLILTLLVLIGLPAQADVVTRYTDGVASARTEADAKVLAIVDAAGRAFGVALQVELTSRLEEVEVSQGGKSVDTYLQSMNRDISQAIEVPTNTPITGYSLNNMSQQADGQWRAEVTIEYAWFEPLGAADDRRTMVVMAPQSELGVKAQQAVQKGLVSERRFNILERDLSGLFRAEKRFIESDNVAAGEIARLGRGAGADYLVSVHVENGYVTEHEQRYIEASQETYYVSAVDFDYHIKVVEFASREVKLVLSDRYSRQARLTSSNDGVVSLMNQFGSHVAQQITSAIYPMRMSVQANGVAVINRGIGVLSSGQYVNVFQQGAELFDPDSGESLDTLETLVGLGQVVAVKPKYALLEMADGTPLLKTEDYIVRLLTKHDYQAIRDAVDSEKREAVKRKKDAFLH